MSALQQAAAPPAAAKKPEAPLAPGSRRVSLVDVLNEVTTLENQGRLEEADSLIGRVLQAAPDHPHVLHIAGIVAYRRGRIAQALTHMERSRALAPEAPLYPRNMCEIYRGAGRLDDALEAGRRGVALAPRDSRALFNLALIHYERLELEEAARVAEAAIAIDPEFPEAHFERAEAHLLAGNLAEGWESYEWRFKLKQAEGMLPKTDKPQWDGSPLEPGKLLMVGDQGFGDCIQFGRLIPWAAARAPAPILACSTELRPLLQQIPGVARLITTWEQAGDFQAYIPLSGLPRLAGIRVDTVPAQIPYLNAPERLVAHWAERLDRLVPRGLRRIALVWAGRPSHKNDRKRTLKLEQFAPLLEREDFAVLTVQKGPAIEQAGNWYKGATLINLGPEINDFLDTMAIIKHVERLVSIDTSVAHLAGAMGVPTSVVLPYAPDWRWLTGRDDTPWYPSLTLFRQHKPYDWSGVVERVVAALG